MLSVVKLGNVPQCVSTTIPLSIISRNILFYLCSPEILSLFAFFAQYFINFFCIFPVL